MSALVLLFLPAVIYQLLVLAACFRQYRRKPLRNGFQPGISVLKPLRGLDPNMYAALRSQALQNYGPFELLFGVQSLDDAAVSHIRALQAEFPALSIRLIAGSEPAANAKVGVLANLAHEAKYDIWVVNDSDIQVGPSYLQTVVEPLADNDVGVVTCIYRATAHTPATAWEALGISVDFIPSALVAPLVGVREFGLGSTLAFRATDLTDIGGFSALSNYIADDYQLARHITQTGKRSVLSSYVVETSLGESSWTGVWQHQLRWARTIRVSKGGGYAGLFVTHAGVWALLACLLQLWPVAVVLLSLRLLGAFFARTLALRIRSGVAAFLLAPVWDFYAFALWFASYLSNEVRWRDRKLTITAGGRIQPSTR